MMDDFNQGPEQFDLHADFGSPEQVDFFDQQPVAPGQPGFDDPQGVDPGAGNVFWLGGDPEGGQVGVFDLDGDRAVDAVLYDANSDGVPDAVVYQEDDHYVIKVDHDGDGVFEDEQTLTPEELQAQSPQLVELLHGHFGDQDPVPSEPLSPQPDDAGEVQQTAPVLVENGQLVGDPQGASEHWFQQAANGFCVPASVAQIVSEYTGVHFADEQAFVTRANELHLFTVGPDGSPSMSVEGAVELLQDAGVPAEAYTGLSVDDLVEYVGEGHPILLAVDAHELWDDAPDAETANHALVLTGFDLERGVAILSDPGSPGGDQFEVTISELDDAWADSQHAAIVCEVPPHEMVAVGTAPEPEVLGFGDVAPVAVHNVGVVDWVLQHPWVVIPVMFGVGALVRRDRSK